MHFFYCLLIFCSKVSHPLSDHLSIHCHHSFNPSRPVARAAQDLYSSSKQIAAVAHANTKVISTPVVLPGLV